MLTDNYLFNQKKERTRPIGKGPRSFIPGGNKPFEGVPKSIKEAVLQYFPEVELLYNKRVNKYGVYRLVEKKNGSDDILVHEFTIANPISNNLVSYMLREDSFRKYGPDQREKMVNREIDTQDKEHADKIKLLEYTRKVRLKKAYENAYKERVISIG